MRAAFWGLAGIALLAAVACANSTELGDYGDAPDNALVIDDYPSLYNSLGPYHVDVSKEWLGKGATSTTTTELDSLQVDLDADDSGGTWFQWGGARNWFYAPVSYDPLLSTANEVRYLNVLTDLDSSGVWEDDAEWLIRNYPVTFDLLPVGVNTLNMAIEVAPSLSFTSLVDSWTRVTLSTETVPDGTGAWAEFARGETEDWYHGSSDSPDDPPVPPPPGGPGPGPNPGLKKLKDITAPVGAKWVRKSNLAACQVCGKQGAVAKWCGGGGPAKAPIHTNSYDLTFTPPGGVAGPITCEMRLDHWDACPCGANLCHGSGLSDPGGPPGGWHQYSDTAARGDWTAWRPVGGVASGVQRTLDGWFGFEKTPAHAWINADVRCTFDPDSEYWEASTFTEPVPLSTPEPCSAFLLLIGAPVVIWVRRKKTG